MIEAFSSEVGTGSREENAREQKAGAIFRSGGVGMRSGVAVRRGRLSLWLLVAVGIAVFIGANWHLVYVAMTSQPDCVVHVKADAARGSAPGTFSAAQSSCTPR